VTDSVHSDHWKRIEALFFEALEIDPSERAAFLSKACIDDPEILRKVEQLLAHLSQTTGLLTKPVREASQQLLKPADLTDREIGSYRICRLLGEGGMGRVYLAERCDDAYQSRVAIKVMNAPLGQQNSMLLRFLTERQILANLQHANIARLLDGGLTSDNTPYLVMEYVDGVPIDQYCRRNVVSIDARLALFSKVAVAVEYAHRQLVVHRDIKPANILVDANGEPKLVDFGIAKLLDEMPDSFAAHNTRNTEFLMTPDYASPEQILGEPISTSTDVYALGILLYELLTESRVYGNERKSPLELARLVCEVEPESPSRILRANPRSSIPDPKRVGPDLDNIVCMALRKKQAERYGSVSDLLADVRAFEEGYPVSARVQSWRYRSGKFIGRHKLGLSLGVAVVIALIGFSIGMGLLAKRVARERERAQTEADFLSNIFRAATPEAARGRAVTARDLLDRGASRIRRELKLPTAVRLPLIATIAEAYTDLGAYDEGLKVLRDAITVPGALNTLPPLERASVLDLEGRIYRLKDQYSDAERWFRQALAIREKESGASSEQVATSLTSLGECLYLEDNYSEAEPLLRRALSLARQHDRNDGADVRNYLALLLQHKGEFSEAAELLREAVDITRHVHGEDSPEYMQTLHNWSSALIDVGDLPGAESRLRRLLDLRRKLLGNNHPDLAYTLNNLGYVLLEEGHWAAAGPYFKENLDLVRRLAGDDHPSTVGAWNNWARYLQAKGGYREAERTFQRALRIATRQSKENRIAAQIEANLGLLAFDRRDFHASEQITQKALEMRRSLGEKDTPAVASCLSDMGLVELFSGNTADAESKFREAMAIRKRHYSGSHPDMILIELRIGDTLMAENKYAAAAEYFDTADRGIANAQFGLPPWLVAETRADLAACRRALHLPAGKWDGTVNRADLEANPRPVFRQDPSVVFARIAHR
jgi:serine/threonine-protein kinase